MDTSAVFRKILIKNELGGDLSLITQFSDPDGVRTGKSGYSFGICQFDLRNNVNALRCLADCHFSPIEIATLVLQLPDVDVDQMQDRLNAAAPHVDTWDTREIDRTINHVRGVVRSAGLVLAHNTVLLHLADYHNQFYMQRAGECVLYLAQVQGAITAEDLLAYKKTTLWGRKRPDDVERRWRNIEQICSEVGL